VLLSDRDIRAEIEAGRVGVEPFHEAMIQPSSVDVRLDKFFRVFENHKYSVIDPSLEQPELTREVIADGAEPFILHPGEFVLASTYEVITLPDDIAAYGSEKYGSRYQGQRGPTPSRSFLNFHRSKID